MGRGRWAGMTIEMTRGVRYQDREIDALKGSESVSTGAAMNEIAKHTGKTQDHVIRGDDKTEREIHAETKDVGAGVKHFAATAGSKAIEFGSEHVLEAGGGIIGGVAIGVAAGGTALLEMGAMMHAVGEDDIAGHERAAAIPKDALHCYMLGNLSGLPREYVDGELARYPESAKTGTFAKALDARLGKGDTALMAVAQLHCDQGMVAARQAIESGGSPKEVAERCKADPAFKAGYEAVRFARHQGPEAYEQVIAGLESRDARYEAAHVAWRPM